MKSLTSISWYVSRLRAMTPVEMAHRVVEKWQRATEASFFSSLEGADPGPADARVPRLPDRGSATAELRQQLAVDAVTLQQGQWQLFGWREVAVGSPPCWHRDPVCGVVIDPEQPAYRLNHRHLPDGADVRSIWEINRWTEMTRLVMHGWLNDDLDAIRTAQLWLEDWCERNAPGMGVNWTSPLEAALRLINFTWLDALIQDTPLPEEGVGPIIRETQERLAQRIVPAHAAWVWRCRSVGSSANNHLLGELAALVLTAARWPQVAAVACSTEAAWALLEAEILHQFAPDGGSREQALHYHLFAFELALQAARTVGCKAGPVYERLLHAMDFFHSAAHGKEAWDFGDNDDAQVLPSTLKRESAGAEWREWMEGKSGALQFWLGLPPALVEEEQGWRVHPDSGLVVFRKGWMARLDASALGFGNLAAHGHCDALHLSLWDGDHALLIDPGTGGYYGYPELRRELAAWTAHNGPRPPSGYRTPVRLGPFLQRRPHEVPRLELLASGALAKLTHEGLSFQRHVAVDDSGITVTDLELHGKPLTVSWIWAPECKVVKEEARTLRITRGASTWLFTVEGAGGELRSQSARVSRAYSKQETAEVWEITVAAGRLTWRVTRS
ncbi:heparinase II/III domain-containing protein [Prosthecobacter debontii]|nr:heparinase II/III family protein [Prosthecobacter debontii]